MVDVIELADCARADAREVGGKAWGLGRLVAEGLPVPAGFALGAGAYRRHVERGALGGPIAAALEGARDDDALADACRRIRELVIGRPLDDDVAREVVAAYRRLVLDHPPGEGPPGPVPVAVRSSASGEDSAEHSFAGQQESYLWVVGEEAVLRAVVRCWASLFTPQALRYRARLDPAGLEGARFDAMGVVVQEMVEAEVAGVLMTLDPLTGDRSQVTIESAYGLGQAVVAGEVSPDRFSVDKVTLELRAESVGHKALAYRFDPVRGGVSARPVEPGRRDVPSITRQEVLQLARLGRTVEGALGGPQDVEWAIGPLAGTSGAGTSGAGTSGAGASGAGASGVGGPRPVHLLQARPETVWSRRERAPLSRPGSSAMDQLLAAVTRHPRPG